MKSLVLLAVQHPLRQNAIEEDPNPSKRQPRHGCEHDQNPAQQENVQQQVGQIVFLALIGVLVPGDVSFVVHRTQERARFSLRNRAGAITTMGPVRLSKTRARNRRSDFRAASCVGLSGRIDLCADVPPPVAASDRRSASAWPSHPQSGTSPRATSALALKSTSCAERGALIFSRPTGPDHVFRGVLHVTRLGKILPAGWADCAAFPAGKGSACDSSRSSAADMAVSFSNTASTRMLPR